MKFLSSIKFSLNKNKPAILFASGMVGAVTTVALAIRATWKAKDIVEDAKQQLDDIKTDVEEKKISEEEAKKLNGRIIRTTAWEVGKTYLSTGVTAAATGLCLVGAYGTQKNRLINTSAALATSVEGFNTLKKAIIDKYGEDELKNLIYGGDDLVITDPDNPENKTKKRIVRDDEPSMYVKYFTPTNPNWKNNMEFNEMFIRQVQSYMNDKLRVNKHVVLNEVYRDLGFKDTKAGMVVGWVLDNANNQAGDNYIEFYTENVCMVNEDGEMEDAILIDFNVDGNIYDKMV